jgi:hypothetical protein
VHLSFRKSSYSGEEGNCVEMATHPDGAALRDSKKPDVVLFFDRAAVADFIDSVKAGEFELDD